MSSRALRKLQGGSDLVSPDLLINGEEERSGESEDHVSSSVPVASKKKKKKKKAVDLPTNPFDLLDEDEAERNIGDSDQEVNDEPATLEEPQTQTAGQSPASKTSKKKKKKKKKKNADVDNTEESQVAVEDEIEASIREVNELLGELPVNPALMAGYTAESLEASARLQPLLTIEHKNLNPDNEMKRKFGSRVVQADANRRRAHNQRRHRTCWLVQPKNHWAPMNKTGLSMSLLETRGGCQYFTFEHNPQYQKLQFQFLDAVESLNPQNIMNMLNLQPYHLDSLIQLSEISRMGEDLQTATDLIERAVYVCEAHFHTLFNVAQGTCRLDYRRPENRSFYIALFRHVMFIGRKGCYRTALEFCKLILSLDPENDPLGVLLMIDFYALRSEQYDYLTRLSHDWESERNLSQLPNFAFSLPLAMFLQTLGDNQDTSQADQLLQQALLQFPGFLIPMLDKCSVKPDDKVSAHTFFGFDAQNKQPGGLQQLLSLYVGRCFPCWKQREVVEWLERNVCETLARVDANDPLVAEYSEKRAVRYKGVPRNILRHLLMSEIKEATVGLPPDLANTPIMSYDPLPPTDSITSYTRPPRRSAAGAQDAGTLAMFLRSLLPNFNPQEPVPEDALGAAGGNAGENLQQGINTLMTAMRDLLNNIQPAAPPVEGEGHLHDDGGEHHEPDEWD